MKLPVNSRRFLLAVGLCLSLAQSAFAVCTWEWRGLYSSWVCPAGETIGGNYSDIFKYLRGQVTGECAKSIAKFYGDDFACLAAISSAVEAAASVTLGGASACASLGNDFQGLSNKCSDQVEFKNAGGNNKGVRARACNHTNGTLKVAVGYKLKGAWYAMGWHYLVPSQCYDMMSSTSSIYMRAESLNGHQAWVPSKLDTVDFCVSTEYRHPYNFKDSVCNSVGYHEMRKFGRIKDTNGNGAATFTLNGDVAASVTGELFNFVYFQEVGIDYPNNDITHFNSSSVDSCQTACSHNSDCRVTAYVKPAGICYLKRDDQNRRSMPNITSSFKWEKRAGFDFPNNDIRDFYGHGWGDCVIACQQKSSCRGAVHDPNTNHCWLKSVMPFETVYGASNRDSYIK